MSKTQQYFVIKERDYTTKNKLQEAMLHIVNGIDKRIVEDIDALKRAINNSIIRSNSQHPRCKPCVLNFWSNGDSFRMEIKVNGTEDSTITYYNIHPIKGTMSFKKGGSDE